VKRALVIGGTGPTGPYVIQGLNDRGYDVAIFHRGVHEPDDLPTVEHIHGDPHFEHTIADALGDRTFDVVLSMYGRLREISKVLAHRCDQLVGVGGIGVYRGLLEPERTRPFGLRIGATEAGPLADEDGSAPRFSALMLEAERSLFSLAASGAYQAAVVRYPQIYGPRSIVPWEWSVIKRVQDGRRQMILPDDGLRIMSRCSARNAAHALLCIVDNAEISNGKAYNCADLDQFTQRQWAEIVIDLVGGSTEIVGIPGILAETTAAELMPARDLAPTALVDASLIRMELGFADVISATDALRECTNWLIDNPPTPGQYPAYLDAFDYEAEDRLISAYQRGVEEIRNEAGIKVPEIFHPLPHPKTPGDGPDERGR